MRSQHRSRRRARNGMTLIEVVVAMAIASILGIAFCALIVTSTNVYETQLKQDDMQFRAREFMDSFTADASAALQVVYSGTAAYTPPTTPPTYTSNPPNGALTPTSSAETFSYPNNFSGIPVTAIPAGTDVIVFLLPSYDSTGEPIQASYDYVGYSWTDSSGNTQGQVIRTCIPGTTSSRPSGYSVVGGQGNNSYDVDLKLSFHVSGQFIPTSKGFQGNTYVDTALSGATPMFQGLAPAAGVQWVDQVLADITITGTIWNQTQTAELVSTNTLRNWDRP